jgi:transcriptional regulator with XRE-family HTH domain
MSDKQVHQGRAIKRIREILGKKQEDLAIDLGMTQQAISLLEAKETVDPKMLDDVAKALKIPVEAIQKFNEEAANNFINSFYDNSVSHVIGNFGTYNFNPIEKVIELYERMLREKDDLIEKLSKK